MSSYKSLFNTSSLEGVDTIETSDLTITDNLDVTGATIIGLSSGSAVETTNLYYTDARFDTRLASKTTDDLDEGITNLYFTDTRVNDNSNVSANTTHRGTTSGNPHNVLPSDLGITNVGSGIIISSSERTQITTNQTDIATNAGNLSTHTSATQAHGATGEVVGTTNTQTLTNKTLTFPVISSISNGGTITIPSGTGTLVTKDSADTLTNKTLTAPVISSIFWGGTISIQAGTYTLIGRDTTDTLTNKTLTSPIISTISNTGTLTLPTSTDTLIGRNTTDTLTNKTFNAVNTFLVSNGDPTKFVRFGLSYPPTATTTIFELPALTDVLIGRTSTDTLTNKTLTSPVISSISNSGTITIPTGTDTLIGRATTDTITGAKTLQNTLVARQINPETTGTYDIGTSSLKYKDIYLSGSIVVGGNVDGVDVSALNTSVSDFSTTLKITNNTAVDCIAGYASSAGSGSSQTIYGSQCGRSASSGSSNSFFGRNVGPALTSGIGNCSFGSLSGQSITSGGTNCAFGTEALRYITTSSNNIGIGYNTLASITTSTGSNISIGHASGAVASGSYNTILGAGADTTASLNYCIPLGYNANCTSSNEMTIGSASTSTTITTIRAGITDTTNLGSSTYKFKDLNISGTALIGTAFNTGTSSMGGHAMAFSGEINGTSSPPRTFSSGNGSTASLGAVMPFSGKVIYMCVSASASLTSCQFILWQNGTTTLHTMAESSVAVGSAYTMTKSISASFSAGDVLAIRHSSSGTCTNAVSTFYVLFD